VIAIKISEFDNHSRKHEAFSCETMQVKSKVDQIEQLYMVVKLVAV